jgi:HlyD family secretion protein
VQLRERQSGIQVQIDSIDEQARLSREELQGYQTLYEKGYAPKTLLLRLQRAIAQAGGQRGGLLSDKTRTQEQIGETQLQLNSLYQERSSEAAENKRKADAVLADVGPRLGAAREALAATVVRAPVDGIVLNLTQHTLGGVAGAGELLLDVVPANAPLVVLAMIKPADIDEVRVGMKAQVDLAAYNAMKVPKVDATVLNVSADSLSNDKTGESYFVAELKIDPTDFRRMPKGVRLYPGMPANVMIITGKRTVMSYLLGPIGDIFDHALRES